MLEIFDTHTHLDAEEFKNDQNEIIERAITHGVTRMVTIGASQGLQSAESAIKIANSHKSVWASVGIHPHSAGDNLDLDHLAKLTSHEKVVAIGETGLDFYRDWAPVDKQYEYFRAQIELAIKVGKPLIIHSREAGNECLKILIEKKASQVGGVFHCYAEDQEFAKKLLDINFLVSVPGTLTFKKADKLREIFKAIPIEQIMLETDAPYMAPEPYRGKRCEPAYTLETAKMLAKIKNLTLEEVALITTKNALKFYRIRNEN
jgi:TatD DNase family protein